MNNEELQTQLLTAEKILRAAAGKADEYRQLAARIKQHELEDLPPLIHVRGGRLIQPDAPTCLATAQYYERCAAEQAQRILTIRKLQNRHR